MDNLSAQSSATFGELNRTNSSDSTIYQSSGFIDDTPDSRTGGEAGEVSMPSHHQPSKHGQRGEKESAMDHNENSNINPPRPPKMITDPSRPDLILQLDTKGISQDQLAEEVKHIYAGLTWVETTTIKLDEQKAADSKHGPLSFEAWKAMISTHKALLNEHHDFLVASQHPSAPELYRLAREYDIAGRMWKHGIHTLLELLRHQLPRSREFMIQFISHSYQMMSSLLQSVPAFKYTWAERLGDLSRYRMATEDEDPRDREIWANTDCSWYCQAADCMPKVRRLQYYLAILNRRNALQMLYLYAKPRMSVRHFLRSRERAGTVLDDTLSSGTVRMIQADEDSVSTINEENIL
jgi:hypothetical protein